MKVCTITLNPALDLTGWLDQLLPGEVNSLKKSTLHPAGKGVNVAQVLIDLGAEVTVTGLLGDENQDPFNQLFASQGMKDEFIRVPGSTRSNVKLAEADGRVTDLNFPGVPIPEDKRQAMEQKLDQLAQEHDVFVLAGSLPPGIEPSLMATWLGQLAAQGKKVLFDSSKQAFQAGVGAKPWLVKPNDDELGQWAGRPLEGRRELKLAAQQLADEGLTNVVVSLGADGVLWLADDQWLSAKPPKMEVVSTVGAGDTLVAGLCWGTLNQWPREQTLAFATAVSALAVSQVGVGVQDAEQVRQMAGQIQVNTESKES